MTISKAERAAWAAAAVERGQSEMVRVLGALDEMEDRAAAREKGWAAVRQRMSEMLDETEARAEAAEARIKKAKQAIHVELNDGRSRAEKESDPVCGLCFVVVACCAGSRCRMGPLRAALADTKGDA